MKRYMARLVLICMLVIYCLPLTAMAAGNGEPPREPYEKVASKSGIWYNERISYDGRSNLVIGYKGDYETQAAEPVLGFSLSEKILLTGVYVPYAGMDSGEVELTIVDSRGNLYQGFTADPTYTLKGSLTSSDGGSESGKHSSQDAVNEGNTLYLFAPEYEIALPKGAYSLVLDGYELPSDAYLVKGYNYAAYQRYQEELQKWAWEEEAEEEEMYASFGEEELRGLLEEYEEYEDFEDEDEYEHLWQGKPQELYAPVFQLDGTYTVDEILLDTWNGGRGEKPGEIRILNEAGNELFSFKAQGAGVADVPNAIWTAFPGVTLPAGLYYLDMTAPEAMTCDEDGNPVFYVGLSAPAAPLTDFTGTYKIWLDLYKTHTLMGPVSEKKSSFSLEDYELSVLDKGTVVELMGQYEGMPFSQNCEIIEREENLVTAEFNFAADLTKLPYSANIAATAQVTLQKEQNGRITVGMKGKGFYSRAATNEKGADENTYELTLRGGRVKKDLPPFVMAAITKAYGAGNIPGPDSPAEAAVGMLFPPLVGLVVSVIQGLLKPQELVSKLSVGEQSMKDANRTLGQGLVSEDEQRAWQMMANALGASGGDPEDPFSIGDNERPGGADYIAPQQSERSDGFGAEYVGPDEDLSFGRPDAPGDVPDYTPEGQGEPPSAGSDMPAQAEPESMVVQTSARGAQTLIVRDPVTGGWVNAETGNPFDLEGHQKNFPKQVKELEDIIKHNEELERTGQTSMQQSLDEIGRKEQEGFNAIQKEIDQRRREQLAREQESLEWQQEHARNTSGMGRIAGDWVVNMGNDVLVLGKAAGKGAKDAVVRTGEVLGTAAGIIVYNPEQAVKKAHESYESVKKTLGEAKDKVVGTAEEVWKKPWIVVKKTMEVGKAAIEIARSPRKQLELIKEEIGISDFGDSLNPNLPITERIGKVLSGTLKLGTAIGTMGTGTAAKTAATTVGKVAASGAKAVNTTRKAVTGAKAVTTARKAVTGTKAATTAGKAATAGTKAATRTATQAAKAGAPKYVVSSKVPDIKGMTKASHRQIQKVADKELVHIKLRPGNPKGPELINSGKAVAKEMDMKLKTLDWRDKFIGGPKDGEGAVGYFWPSKPSVKDMRTLTAKQQTEVMDQFNHRLKEYKKYGRELDAMSDKYQVIDKKVYQKVTVTVQEGGKTTKKSALKMVASDNDVAEITDVMGKPVSEARKKRIMSEMMNIPESNVKHQDLAAWKPGDHAFNPEAKAKMVKDTMDGGKGVISINPNAFPTHEYLTGV